MDIEDVQAALRASADPTLRIEAAGERVHVDDADGRCICTIQVPEFIVWVTCTVHHGPEVAEETVLAKMSELAGTLEARGYGTELLPSSGTGDALEEALCRTVPQEHLADEVHWLSERTFEVWV